MKKRWSEGRGSEKRQTVAQLRELLTLWDSREDAPQEDPPQVKGARAYLAGLDARRFRFRVVK